MLVLAHAAKHVVGGPGQAFFVQGAQGLAGAADNMVSRVAKFEHRLQEAYNFTRHEIAILSELLLRGPQTPGELRSRANRMCGKCEFTDADQVEAVLVSLAQREDGPFVIRLPREPGRRESRYAHLFGGEVTGVEEEATPVDSPRRLGGVGRESEMLIALQQRVETLEAEVAELRSLINLPT